MRICTTTTGFAVVAALLFSCCQNKTGCREIKGKWDDREGHNFVFYEYGKALWLNRFGQMVDTVSFVFVLNCNTSPASIDFKDFSGGPFSGKTLYGIMEWSADSLFRLCYDIGQEPSCRPKTFDPEQTMKFFR